MGVSPPASAGERIGKAEEAPAAQLRIGVYGGAFDPPHRTHVAVARCAVEQIGLDALHVLPTGQAWHKPRALSPAKQRLAMTQLAFAGLPHTVVDGREIARRGPTYTIDTLEELQAEHPAAQLYLVIGADQADALHTWHRVGDIARIAIISVAARADGTSAAGPFGIKNLPQARCLRLHLPPTDVSATDIRSRIAQGMGIDQLVPCAVARYIERHHLYQTA
ncbi:nicotinate-nucleotide adenylyltransferase [Ramlibacter sp. H39-3-26]|uniref:nicotinate-nucleotide adenylyltransferase n=1 Tax=Curvibacter soli TaxID=3031331 RepID=UPI0023DC988C|nr:nicotinate-nucleotide adenylyltransferase [Ramlibacter sp. H39-3-26]MDF1485485.1 nicotinate-nucleotide adenylyltransferase [Ramlibacter sp. H39-3-26]